MDAREVERRVRDLEKATTANESSSTLITILTDLSKGITATESLLRTTKVGKAVNRLRTHKDAAVARASADLVLKWKKDMKGEGTPSKKGGAASPAAAESGKSTPLGAGSSATNVVREEKKEKVDGKEGYNSSVPPEKRSSKTDKINTDVTGNSVRDPCVTLMYDGLANMTTERKLSMSCNLGDTICLRQAALRSQLKSNSVNVNVHIAPALILTLATAIEAAAFASLGPEEKEPYKTKIRSLYQNLKSKSNPQLRRRIISGEISPDRLVHMTSEELKSDERKAEDKLLMKENMDKAMVPQVEKSISSQLRCGKCGQKKVSYSQAQTRSADEPMTTFCECTVCGNRWKFS